MKAFFNNIQQKGKKIGMIIVEKLRNHPFFCNIILSVVMAFLLEVLGRQTFDLSAVGFVDQRSKMFIYSVLIIFLTYSIVFIVKRRLFTYIIVTLLWSIVGIVNFMMLSSRNTPFTYVDITLMKSVLPVMTNYFSPMEIASMGTLILILLVLLVVSYMYLPMEKNLNRKTGIVKMLFIVVVFAGTTIYGFKSGMLVDQIHNIRIAFSDYGTPYCFSITALKNGIEKPSDYSEKKIESIEKRTNDEIAKKEAAEKKNNEKVKTPNIIFVQLESHFDITQVKGISFNKDPLENFHKYMKGYSSGQLSMPSYGAGTANSEFETITGMNLDHFGAAEYPYKTVLQDTTTESMATVLKSYGYTAHAIHNNSAAFYDRDLVFSQLGFDTFTTKESMNIKKWTENGWAKDLILTSCINDSLDSTENQDYIYCISVQGHGDYPTTEIIENPEITVNGIEDEALRNKYTYYANQVYQMDQFVGRLVKSLEKRNEETILVMYGDHLPSLEIEDNDLTYGNKYETSYFIWDNMNLKKEDGVIEAYDLGSEILDKCNIHNGIMNSFHQTRKGTKNYQKDMKELQYDMLYGKRYIWNQENPFKATDITFGIKDLVVTKAYETEDSVFIVGDNFTNYCEVSVGDMQINTTYHNEHLLEVSKKDLKDGDTFTVSIISKAPRVLRTSNAYIYKEKNEN
ncbi:MULTISPECIES: LTA synthase family protein [Anaerostipes]|uniref:LTA synthase family protein n=1 Tax=Anaerostipes TaxID=207244 RepID=UPI001C1E7136|nr:MULTISPECIES: alkaline phosphatase family protein [Anaerostipes]MCI5624115.1 sulfatase-like hydrolase/transferase [Anaerostipes sp.]